MPHQTDTVGAQCRPDRELACAAFRAHEQEVGHVRARNQQQAPDCRKHQPQCRSYRGQGFVRDAGGKRAKLHRLRIRPLRCQGRRQRREFGVGLCDRHAGFQACRGVIAVVAAIVEFQLERRPQAGGFLRIDHVVGGQPEAARHDANHFPGDAVDVDGAADERLASVASLPQFIAEDDDTRWRDGRFFFGEPAANEWRHPEHRQQVGRNGRGADTHRVGVAACDVHLRNIPGPHVGERGGARLVVVDFRVGDPRLVEVAPLAPDHRHAVRFRVGQGRQQDVLHHAEHGRVRTDSQGQRQDSCHGEPGLFAQDTTGIPHIAPQITQQPAAGFARCQPRGGGRLVEPPHARRQGSGFLEFRQRQGPGGDDVLSLEREVSHTFVEMLGEFFENLGFALRSEAQAGKVWAEQRRPVRHVRLR